MLTVPRSYIVEKIIQNPEGVSYRAVFLVYEEGGRIKARLIEAKEIVEAPAKTEPCYLPICLQKTVYAEIFDVTFGKDFIPSPYSSILNFTCSKPRAPTK